MRSLLAAVCGLFLASFVIGCGSNAASEPSDSVIIATVTRTAPETSSTPLAVQTRPAVSQPAQAEPTQRAAVLAATPTAPAILPPTATPVVQVALPGRPTTGRWIDVDVTRFVVQLMDGGQVLQTVGPVAVGRQVDTGVYESTQTGLFHVYIKTPDLTYDAPYDTYISHWVGFDPDKANGFHSFLKDANGAVVDASTGRVSNGCIRTGAAEAIYAFAQVGMPVFVHH